MDEPDLHPTLKADLQAPRSGQEHDFALTSDARDPGRDSKQLLEDGLSPKQMRTWKKPCRSGHGMVDDVVKHLLHLLQGTVFGTGQIG